MAPAASMRLAEGSTAMSSVLMICSTVVNVTRLGSAAPVRLIPITSVKLRSWEHRQLEPHGEDLIATVEVPANPA
jgi:hypothetical protein